MIGLEFTWSYCLDPIEGTSTPLSSGVLQVTHLLMLIFLWWSRTVVVNKSIIKIVDLTKGKKKKLQKILEIQEVQRLKYFDLMMLSLRNKDVVGLVDEIYVKSRIAKL